VNANNPNAASSLGLGGIPYAPNNGGLPSFSVTGMAGFGSPTFYATNEYQNVYQILDNVTKVVGNHTLKAGVSFQRLRFSTSQPTQPRGSYTFNGTYTSKVGVANTGFGLADFLTNNMSSAAISNVFTSDDVRWNRAGYVQDDWKATQRLTINYGVRYDFTQPYYERHDNQAAFVPTSGPTAGKSTGLYLIPASKQGVALSTAFTRLLALDNITTQYSNDRSLIQSQKSNIGPRVGFAFKATDKAVLRGGYGIFFGGLESTGYYPNLGENYPFEFDSSFAAGTCTAGGSCVNNGFTLERGFTDAIAAGLQNSISQPTLRGSEARVRTPYSQQFNLTTEYGIDNYTVATLSYVGSIARHLQSFPNPNGQVALAPNGFSGYVNTSGDKVNPLQPYPHFGGFSYTAYDANSSYNALQAKLERRTNKGFSYLATYTWAHSLDDAPTPLGSTNDGGYRSLNILGLGADYANSPFDVRQRFTLNGNYELPFGRGRQFLNSSGLLDYLVGGWSTSLVFRAQTGQPVTIGTNNISSPSGATAYAIRTGDPNQAGGSANSTNPGITCPTRVRTVQNWYNPCAFANPRASDITYTTTKYADSKSGADFVPNTVSGAAAAAYLGSPRGQIYGPGYERVDASLFKSFHTFREQNLTFRTDVFNLLNTPGYGNPSTTNISSKGGNITSLRTFQSNTPDSRFFQFSLKYAF
jgi:hypothetical protein